MVRRLSASSVREHSAVVSLLFALLMPYSGAWGAEGEAAPEKAEAAPATSAPAEAIPSGASLNPIAAESPDTTDVKEQTDPNFLLLPAYDVNWEKAPEAMKVGDSVTAKLTGDSKEKNDALPKDFKIKIPPGTENADDLGFILSEPSDGHFTVNVVKSGHITVPSLELTDNADKPIGRTNPLALEVATAIAPNDPSPKQAEPPKPPVSLGFPTSTLIMMAILALALLAGGVYLLVRWSRNRRSSGLPADEGPPKPEDEIALSALAQLEKKGLLKEGRFKPYYFALSEIVKHYVGSRYKFDAAESTTYEMLSYLERSKGLSQDRLNGFREFFEKLDRVKFTDFRPVAIEGTELIEEAKKFVMITRRPPPIVSPSGTGETKNASR